LLSPEDFSESDSDSESDSESSSTLNLSWFISCSRLGRPLRDFFDCWSLLKTVYSY
jgi:hypothetical protein